MSGFSNIRPELIRAFTSEADVQIETVLTSLLAMESATADEQMSLIEDSFRQIHNLKGSARSVGLTGFASFCHPIEDLFSALKRKELALSADAVHWLISTIKKLKTALADTSCEPSEEEITSLKRECAARLVGQITEGNNQTVTGATQPRPVERRKTNRDRRLSSAKAEEIRVSASKLESILQRAEEMIPTRLMATQQAQILLELSEKIEQDMRSYKPQETMVALGLSEIEALIEPGATARELTVWKYLKEVLGSQSRLLNQLRSDSHEIARRAAELAYINQIAVSEIIEDSRNLLMMPCATVFDALPMMVRELSLELGKQVDLSMDGLEIELDRRILNGLRDPINHLVRNCLDHGIESPAERSSVGKPTSGSLSIRVQQLSGGKIEIRIADDGHGIDRDKLCLAALKSSVIIESEANSMSEEEKLMLMFRSSVTTSNIVTEISGRGIGMAVVQDNVVKLGGRLEVVSEVGQGTAFSLILPVALATFSGIQISVGGRIFILPSHEIGRVVRISPDQVSLLHGTIPCVCIDEEWIPLCSLHTLLNLDKTDKQGDDSSCLTAIVLGEAKHRMAMVVDDIRDEQEVLVKPLGPSFSSLPIYLGVSLMGDGKLAPVLNARELVMFRERNKTIGEKQETEIVSKSSAPHAVQKRVLVVDDTLTARMLLSQIFESAGFVTEVAVDGAHAIQQIERSHFDLVVTDLEMPEINGFELTKMIRARLAVPIIIVTSKSSKEDREKAVRAGASAYFVKGSFDHTNLLEVAARLL